jgi:threonyl-tRNA synthetase
VLGVLDLASYMMEAFHYTCSYYLATRPEKFLGTEEQWAFATDCLKQALERKGLPYKIDEGGGVFYAPKIDVKLADSLGREWQGPTIQVDLNLPNRFDVNYVAADNRPHRVVMIHRTVLGSMERFIGGLIEHVGGAFPLWLAPEQARVLPITEKQVDAARISSLIFSSSLPSSLPIVLSFGHSEGLRAAARRARTSSRISATTASTVAPPRSPPERERTDTFPDSASFAPTISM